MLLQRYLPIVFACTTLVLTIQQLAWAQGVEQAREEQRLVGCLLQRNESIRGDFYYSIGSREESRLSRYIEGIDVNVRCWALNACPGAPVSWCIYQYHPEKAVELCYNSTGHVTRETEFAAALRLDEKFQIKPELCPSRWPGCIRAISPELFQSFSYLTCTAKTDTCYKRTFSIFDVIDSGDAETSPPVVTFDNGLDSADMVLNKTNLFQCNVNMTSVTYLRGVHAGWTINGVRFSNPIPQHPDCEKNPSVRSNSEDCITTFEDTGMQKRMRVRSYMVQYIHQSCPYPTLMITVWLLIEKASMADVGMKYECYGEYLFSNPLPTMVSTRRDLNVNPVYPLLEVIPMDVPLIPANIFYQLEPNETLQWNCSVQAGLGDRLIWRRNGQEIHHTDINDLNDSISTEDFSCSSLALAQDRDSFVITKTKELGEYERLFMSTLHICQVTEYTAGAYECVVHRLRGDVRNVNVWSATVLSTASTTTVTQAPEATVHGITNRPLIIISVSVVISSIAMVLVFVTMITLCVRCYRKRHKSNTRAVWELAMGSISVTDDILTEFRRKNSLKREVTGSLSLEQKDPMEFPRNRLILLDRVLGEGTFGLVRQARAEGIVESTPERNIVAVKTTRAKAPKEENNNFWEELLLMKKMIPHANIVNLLGHCTTPDGPIYMIIEYANHGSLRDFLKKCEEAVLKLNHIPQVQQSFRFCRANSMNADSSMYPHLVFKLPLSAQDSVFSAGGTPTPLNTTASSNKKLDFSYTRYLASKEELAKQDSGFFGENVDQAAFNDTSSGSLMAHTVAPLTHDYVNTKGLIYMEDVQNFALQIACGLKHLEDIQIVHCDLAARNILIAEGFVLKIGDFGMARDVSEKEYYRKEGGRIPVKWTAPEALMDHIFTFKSDIWSFGVILWEIITYGQQPYPRFKIRHSWEPFINYLMEGNRLEQPRGCPDSFYTLMKSCWCSSPEQRPSAEDLVQILSQVNLSYKPDTLSTSDSGTQLSMRCSTGGYPQETPV